MPTDTDNPVAWTVGVRDAEIAPFGYISIFTVYFGELGDRNFIKRRVVMDINRERIVADDKFLRCFTVFCVASSNSLGLI